MSQADESGQQALIIVARGVRVRGLKGELVAELLTDFPERFEQISELCAVGTSGERRQLALEKHWFQNDRIVLKFAGYDDVETARSLVGLEFGVPETDRVQLSQDEFYDWELEGCSVEILQGAHLGTVSGVLRTGGVELLVVEDEGRQERLIPMAQPIVVEIDISSRKIVIDPPEGLLDL